MKSLIYILAGASIVAAPVASFAQQNEPLTRAAVRDQLVQLEAAGYKPDLNDKYYPKDIQAAEARVAAQSAAAQAGINGYGPAINGSSQSGAQ